MASTRRAVAVAAMPFCTSCWAEATCASRPLPLCFCVVGVLFSNGLLTKSSSAWFCQKQITNASPSTATQTISRERSSSR